MAKTRESKQGFVGGRKENNAAEFRRTMSPQKQSAGVGLPAASSRIGVHRPFDLHSTRGTIANAGENSGVGPLKERPESSSGRLSGGLWAQIIYVVLDSLWICVDAALAVYLRFVPDSLPSALHQNRFGLSADFPLSQYAAFLLLYVTLVVLFCKGQDLYRTPRTRPSWDETLRVTKAVSLATLFLVGFIFLSGFKLVSREVVIVASMLNIVTLSAWRLWKKQLVIHRVAQGVGTRNALIIGAGKVGQALAQHLEENKLLGFRFKGFLDANHHTDTRLRGKIEDLCRVARAEFVDDIFITIPSERELVKRVAFEAQRNRWSVKVVPELYDGLGWNAPLDYVGDFPVMELYWESIPAVGFVVKRVLDVILSALGLLVLSPILSVLAILVRVDSPGSPLYRSQRVGLKGRAFVCYKFRTMVANADALKKKLSHLNERNGPFFKITNDPRITPLGRFLRRYSLDELPQLWNVLKGDMSLVGPRPHTLDDYSQYNVDQLRRLEVKPGVTGLWQVKARRDPSFETSMRLDLKYIEDWNLWLDVRLLAMTLAAVFRSKGT